MPGAYSEAAALAAFPGCDPLPCRTFEGAFQAAAQWSADAAVVPIENSLGGSIHAVYDLLLRYGGDSGGLGGIGGIGGGGGNLRIVGEVGVAVSHCLLAPAGTEIEDLDEVTSHPQALAQCDGFIRSLSDFKKGGGGVDPDGRTKKKVAKIAAEDTAGSAAELAARWAAEADDGNEGNGGNGGGIVDGSGTQKRRKKNTTAAIASARAAELYGLEILASDIQDADARSNVTRFLVLVREPAAPGPSPGDPRPHKASVAFSLPDGPGALFRALSVFALRDISMTKVESRPARDAPLLLEEGVDDDDDEVEEKDEEDEEEEEGSEGEEGDGTSFESFDEEDEPSSSSAPVPPSSSSRSSKSSSNKANKRRRRRRRFNYLFYVDVRANLADPHAQNALRHLREIAPFMSVLG